MGTSALVELAAWVGGSGWIGFGWLAFEALRYRRKAQSLERDALECEAYLERPLVSAFGLAAPLSWLNHPMYPVFRSILAAMSSPIPFDPFT